MEIKITKKSLLFSVSNSMYSADYWLINGRIYNDEKTRYYKFKFILFIDPVNDLYDTETETFLDYNEFLNDLIFSFCDEMGNDYNNINKINSFIDKCNETLEKWNAQFKHA